jgi:hypothetical protein
MSRSVIFRLALALAVILGLSRLPGTAFAAGSNGSAALSHEPANLSPEARAMWLWRQALDGTRRATSDPAPLAAPRLASTAAATQDLDQVVITDTTGSLGSEQDQLAIASYPGRNIVLVWRDARFGDGDLRALLFDPSGRQLAQPGSPVGDFLVNDDGQAVDQQRPAVAMNSLGQFVVVWTDGRQGSGDIWLQRFEADGSPVGENVKVNTGRDDDRKFTHTRPAVALGDDGQVVVAWMDDRNGSSNDVYAARLAADNSLKVNPFLVSSTIGTTDKLLFKPFDSTGPSVALSGAPGDTSFVVAWQARNLVNRGARRAIFGRLFRAFNPIKGTPLDQQMVLLDNRKPGDATVVKNADSPVLLPPVAGDTSLSYTLVWVDSTSGKGVVSARRISGSSWARIGNPLADTGLAAIRVVSDSVGLAAGAPGAARLRDGSLSVSWIAQQQADGSLQTVHHRLVSASLQPLGASQRLNSGGDATRRAFARTAAFGTDQEPAARMAAWVDRRSGNWDATVRVLGSGASQDSALVHDRQPDQINPHLAYNDAGKGVAVWTDYRKGFSDPDIFAQVMDASGAPVGANFRVNSDAAGAFQDHPKVAMDSLGAFTVVWEDARSGNFLVYARHFGTDNAATGAEWLVAPLAGAARDSFQQFRPVISVTHAGAGVVAWEDNRRVTIGANPVHIMDIMMVAVDASGQPQGTAVRASAGDSKTGTPSLDPALALDPEGNGFLFYSTSVTQVLASGTIVNKDVAGRYFQAPARMAVMLDSKGRQIASQAFSVADTLGSGFLFAQSRASAGYLGRQTYAVAFQDQRLTTTAREDIRAQLYRVQALTGDTAQVYIDGLNFLVNDDTVRLEPDAAGIVYFLSASQFSPAVASSPAGSAFTVMWADRRTGSNYNVMRQSYRVFPSDTLGRPSRLRLLGRNTFVNTDIEIQDAVHGMAAPCYAGPDQLAAVWQSDRIKARGYDVYWRSVTQAPDTCANDNCLFAPRFALQARLEGASVRLSWQVPAGVAGEGVQLLRYDVAAYRSQDWSRPTLVGNFPADAGAYQADDRIDGAGAGYLYELLRDGEVVATAIPAAVEVRFALGLNAVSPNPARGAARIAFTVPGRALDRVPVKLHIYDVSGRRVRTLVQDVRTAGPHEASWSGDVEGGARAGTGVYFLRLDAGGQSASRKLLWLH